MSNLPVRKTPAQPASTAAWDPFRLMREMVRWDPFREMAPLLPADATAFDPAFDVRETKDAYVFRADMPGMKSDDVSVTVEGGRLNVSGTRESEHEEKGDTYYSRERTFGSFVRTFTLPQGANASDVRADLTDGVLTVSIAKAAEAQPRAIKVGNGSKSKS